jgi:glycogen operon protein
MLISGEAADERDDRGRPVRGDTMLLLLNGGFDDVEWTLPTVAGDGHWRYVVDTASDVQGPVGTDKMQLRGFSLMLLRHGIDRRSEIPSMTHAAQPQPAGQSTSTTGAPSEAPAAGAPNAEAEMLVPGGAVPEETPTETAPAETAPAEAGV